MSSREVTTNTEQCKTDWRVHCEDLIINCKSLAVQLREEGERLFELNCAHIVNLLTQVQDESRQRPLQLMTKL